MLIETLIDGAEMEKVTALKELRRDWDKIVEFAEESSLKCNEELPKTQELDFCEETLPNTEESD